MWKAHEQQSWSCAKGMHAGARAVQRLGHACSPYHAHTIAGAVACIYIHVEHVQARCRGRIAGMHTHRACICIQRCHCRRCWAAAECCAIKVNKDVVVTPPACALGPLRTAPRACHGQCTSASGAPKRRILGSAAAPTHAPRSGWKVCAPLSCWGPADGPSQGLLRGVGAWGWGARHLVLPRTGQGETAGRHPWCQSGRIQEHQLRQIPPRGILKPPGQDRRGVSCA